MDLHHSLLAIRAISPQLEDRSKTITIATYGLTGAFAVCFIARQVMKAVVFRKVALDDLFILLAITCGIGLSIATLILTSNGFGVSGHLTIERADTIMKGYYASELLYISTLCFSKLSMLVLFYNVVVLRSHRFFVLGFGVCIFVWSVASIIAAAFQCDLPRPWAMLTLRCFNKRIFWIVFCAVDMFTEVSIIMLSVDLVAHLRVRLSRKFAVVACFAPRLLVVGAALIRAVFLYQVTPHENPEYDLWISTICTQAHVSASICTACIPYMVPFFKSLQGNLWRSYSARSWAARSRSARSSGAPPNPPKIREAKMQSGPPKSVASLVREPERVSIISPRIPSPTPISPFLPPPISTLRVPTTPSRTEVRGVRGLSVSRTLYDSESDEMFDMVSLQTAMSFAPSPIEPPARAHVASPVVVDISESFEIIALLGSPDLSSSSSCYSSRASTPARPESHPRFSLFALDDQQSAPLLHAQRASCSAAQMARCLDAASDEAGRLLARQTLPYPAVPHTFDDFAHPARTASSRSHPKFSTTPRLHAAATPTEQT